VRGRRGAVLEALRASNVPLSIVDLAEALGVHPNTVRFHLDGLVHAGRVERVDSAPVGPGRPPAVFRSRPGMDPAGPSNYRLLAAMLASELAAGPAPVARATDLGRRWGGSVIEQPGCGETLTTDQAVGRLTDLLDGLGFSPQRRSDGGQTEIALRHCPFLELIDTQGEVICSLHLGLMQGAMAQLDPTASVDRLQPFAEPDLCLAHLSVPADPA